MNELERSRAVDSAAGGVVGVSVPQLARPATIIVLARRIEDRCVDLMAFLLAGRASLSENRESSPERPFEPPRRSWS
jgi:hypothetical protein